MSRSDRILVAAAGGAVILVIAAATILLLPVEGESEDPTASLILGSAVPTGAPVSAAPASGTIVVDVEGGVLQPGIRELPAGSRVADAISAAGGYSSDVDLAATSATINLAQPLTDGEQIVVPRIGDQVAAPGGTGASAPAAGGTGLVDLNTATPEELEALPGIGAVTVQKIVAAREERPFTSLQDAVDRDVINNGQLEDIQALATAG